MKHSTLTCIAMFPLIFGANEAHAADPHPLFASSDILEVTVEGPFDTLMDQRSEDDQYDGKLSYENASGESVTLDVKLRVRGRFRAKKDVCDFAPLRLNFKKKQVDDTIFDGQDKLKLVTHCQNKSKEYEQQLLKEYMTYQFLSTLSDNAFKTRLMRITYVDSEGKGKSKKRERYGFVIEHEDDLAKRLGTKPANTANIMFDQLNPAQTNLLTVYSYFIGNTDFSAIRGPEKEYCCHNVELFLDDANHYLPIPYDFDFSGMVNAPYAKPAESIGVRNVTNRVYRGLCSNNERLDDTLNLFLEAKEKFYDLVADQKGLSRVHRSKMRRYLSGFYSVIGKESKIDKEFIKECSSASGPPGPT